MTYFNFTTHDHELTLREMSEMKRAVMAQIVAAPTASPWARIAQIYALLAARAQMLGGPVLAGALTLVLVVGLGGSARYAGYLGGDSASTIAADSVVSATDVLLAEMSQSDAQLSMSSTTAAAPEVTTFAAADARMARSVGEAESTMMAAERALPTTATTEIPRTVTDALAAIDTALTGSSTVADVPLARIVASLASLQSVAETHVEEGTATPTDEAVLAFIADKKPLLSLLVSTASNEEKLAIHTAASEFILTDVRATGDTAGVFAESYLATRDTHTDDYDATAQLLDDLSTVKAVASASAPNL